MKTFVETSLLRSASSEKVKWDDIWEIDMEIKKIKAIYDVKWMLA